MEGLQESDLVCVHLLQPKENQYPAGQLHWPTMTNLNKKTRLLSLIPSVQHLNPTPPLLLLTIKIPKYISLTYLTNCELFGAQETSLLTEIEVNSEWNVIPSKINKCDRKAVEKK
jgi:hypothetical protein